MADFNALSNELRILIIKHVDDAPTTDDDNDDDGGYPTDVNYRLPRVKVDLLNLSLVNHKLRSLVAPFLFRNLILRNTVWSGTSIGLVARSGLAKHVRRLRFVGTSVIPMYPPEYSGPRELRDVELPATVQQALSNLDCFPVLEGVDVWFVLQQDSESGLEEFKGGYLMYFIHHECWRQPLLSDQVFLALARNQPKVVKELKLYNFMPDLNGGLCCAELHAFLGALSSFGMQLCADWGCIQRYWGTTEDATKKLWNPLRNITHLSVASGPRELLGLDGQGVSVNPLLDLAYAPLPNLTSIAFDFIVVDYDLLNTLLKHNGTLRSVRMNHVFVPLFSKNIVGDYKHTTWAEFFTELDDSYWSFSSLTDFEVLCTGDWTETRMVAGKQRRAKDGERQRMLEEGTPELRYCLVTQTGSGYRTEFDIKEHEDSDHIIDPGEDRLAYDRFMETVKSNRARLGIA